MVNLPFCQRFHTFSNLTYNIARYLENKIQELGVQLVFLCAYQADGARSGLFQVLSTDVALGMLALPNASAEQVL